MHMNFKSKSVFMVGLLFIAIGMMSQQVSAAGSHDQIVIGGGVINDWVFGNSTVIIFTNSTVENVTIKFGDINTQMIEVEAANDSLVSQFVYVGDLGNETKMTFLMMPQNVTYEMNCNVITAVNVTVANDNNNTNINENENVNQNNNTYNLWLSAGEYFEANQWILWGIGIAFLAVIAFVGIVQVSQKVDERHRKQL